MSKNKIIIQMNEQGSARGFWGWKMLIVKYFYDPRTYDFYKPQINHQIFFTICIEQKKKKKSDLKVYLNPCWMKALNILDTRWMQV